MITPSIALFPSIESTKGEVVPLTSLLSAFEGRRAPLYSIHSIPDRTKGSPVQSQGFAAGEVWGLALDIDFHDAAGHRIAATPEMGDAVLAKIHPDFYMVHFTPGGGVRAIYVYPKPEKITAAEHRRRVAHAARGQAIDGCSLEFGRIYFAPFTKGLRTPDKGSPDTTGIPYVLNEGRVFACPDGEGPEIVLEGKAGAVPAPLAANKTKSIPPIPYHDESIPHDDRVKGLMGKVSKLRRPGQLASNDDYFREIICAVSKLCIEWSIVPNKCDELVAWCEEYDDEYESVSGKKVAQTTIGRITGTHAGDVDAQEKHHPDLLSIEESERLKRELENLKNRDRLEEIGSDLFLPPQIDQMLLSVGKDFLVWDVVTGKWSHSDAHSYDDIMARNSRLVQNLAAATPDFDTFKLHVNSKGEAVRKPKDRMEIAREYSTKLHSGEPLVASMRDTPGLRLKGNSHQLIFRPYDLCPSLRPVRNRLVHAWLVELGGRKANRFIPWCSQYADLSKALCAMHIEGERCVGKSLFGYSLARLTDSRGGFVTPEIIERQFNEICVYNSLVWGNEATKVKDITNLLKNTLGDEIRTVERKNGPTYHVQMMARWLFTVNDSSIISGIVFDNTSKAKREAIGARICHIRPSEHAAEACAALVASVPRDELTKVIAEHLLWMNQNEPQTMNDTDDRFAVSGDLHLDDNREAILAAPAADDLASAILDKIHDKAMDWVREEGGRTWIGPASFVARWWGKDVSKEKIGEILRAITGSGPVKKSMGGCRALLYPYTPPKE